MLSIFLSLKITNYWKQFFVLKFPINRSKLVSEQKLYGLVYSRNSHIYMLCNIYINLATRCAHCVQTMKNFKKGDSPQQLSFQSSNLKT